MFSHIKELFTRPSGYTIARSVRLRSSASAYFNRTPASAGNRQKFTWSAWFKRGVMSDANLTWLSGAGASDETNIYIRDTDIFELRQVTSGAEAWKISTTQVFRDPSSWYHFVVAFDTTQATASNRIKIYVNGVQVTAFSTANYPSQNFNTEFNNTTGQYIGKRATSSAYCDGYLTEINFIDGQALTPSSFGETDSITGVWKAKKYSGTYGTNGFYLNFSDNSSNTATTIGKDYSGNGNNWTPNNISVTAGSTYDSMVDSPTVSAVSSNYCVLNPILGDSLDLPKDGNLKVGGTNDNYSVGTIAFPTTGKYYAEATVTAYSSGQVQIGICPVNAKSNLGNDATAYLNSGSTTKNNSASTTLSSYTQGDVIGIAVDVDNSTVQFYKNNTAQTALTSVLRISDASFFTYMNISSSIVNYNFGQRPFSYTPPTGFVALNTYNLPASTIKNGAAYMAATTYTGTGSTQSITNTVGSTSFQPDLVWVKERSNNGFGNALFDSVRGTPRRLGSNLTEAENTTGSFGQVSAFNSNGFTVATGTTSFGETGGNGFTYVGWQWKAGGTSSSNTNGSITSTVSAGATQGFSVVTYTGTGANATVGHGLGVAPSMIIIKQRSTTTSWAVYHSGLTSAAYVINLNLTSGQAGPNTVFWNSTAPTSTVFSLGTGTDANASGATAVAYCFAAVAGYSAFGSYTGNGSTDGPFIFTGFRPRFVVVKRTDGTSHWQMFDSSRSTYNAIGNMLIANLSDAEYAQPPYFDFLSNGIKARGTGAGQSGGDYNFSGGTYIYMAFAENPFKYSLAR